MLVESLLRTDRICCRVTGDKQTALLRLAECGARSAPSLDKTQILDGIARREQLGSMCLGKGIAFCHVRTEKVPDLSIFLATSPDGVPGFETPDEVPVRLIFLFLIPKQHSDHYLRAVALLANTFSSPETAEQVVRAATPEEVIGAVQGQRTDDEIESLLLKFADNGDKGSAAGIFDRIPSVDLASLAEDLSPVKRARVLRSLEPSRAAAIAYYMHLVPLAAAIRRIPAEHAARILGFIDSARAAEIIRKLNRDEQAAILKHLMGRGKGEIQTILKYPPTKAGGIMTPEVVSFGPDVPIGVALSALGSFKDRRQTDAYVTSAEGKLLGRCTIHELLLAPTEQTVGQIMNRNPETVLPDRDHTDLQRMFAQKHLRSLAVVSPEGRLLGVVTQDDLIDVIEQEAHEDIQKMVSGSTLVDPIHTPVFTRLRIRLPWLLFALGGELLIALLITSFFTDTIAKAVLLTAFLAPIAATGGNVGIMATTTIIRALGMGTLKKRHTWKVILSEIRLGLTLGLLCGLIAGGVAWLINWNYAEVSRLSFSVFLAMVSATFATSAVGTLTPLVLHRMGHDPATACGPFVTVFNDIFGNVVYLTIAMYMNFPAAPSG